jgi:hypothetical protein
LDNEQYDAFLGGENPLAETTIEVGPLELYGSHLK